MAVASGLTFLSPERVKSMLRGPDHERVLVMDVRDSDYHGGHIKGAINIAAARFHEDSMVDHIISRFCRDVEVVVIHCHLSQQRAPFCASRLAERLEAQRCMLPQVCVMAGGWKRFQQELELEDLELVEGLRAAWGRA